MLMRPHVVVPDAERLQLEVELGSVRDRDAIEVLLQRAEEAFDPPVLPGAMRFGGLKVDAQQLQVDADQA